MKSNGGCDDGGGGDEGGEAPAAAKEAWKQIRLALPMMGTNLVQFAIQLLSIMFVGHLGELELSSASIATSFCGVTGYSFLLGLSTALETLCGQAYGGEHYGLLGIFMQRAMLVLTVIAVPISVLWYNMEHVLLLFGQAPDISQMAGVYARYLIPGLFAYAFLQPLIKFLQTQSIVLPMFICSSVTLLLHSVLCWTLIYKLEMGNRGAAISSSVSNWLNVAFLTAVVAFTPRCRKCWQGLSKEAFRDVREFLKLAIPSAIMVCLEWWSFEALVLLAGVLPKPQLEASVFSIVLNLNGLCYMIPYGIGAAASTRISNELGAGRASAARFAFLIAVSLAVLNATVISSSLYMARDLLGRAFSNEGEVISYVSRMMPLMAWIAAMDSIQGTISGVSRGCGWQAFAAFANLGAYYLVGLPLGFVLAFRAGFGGQGLLIGIGAGVSTQATAFVIIALLTNWTKQAENALDRIDHQHSLGMPLLH